MSRDKIYFGTGAGINWIPTDGPNARETNLRTLREIADTGVRDIQINFFLQCYYDLENYDAYLSLADELGLNITFLFREVEAIGEMTGGRDTYHNDLGLMTLGESDKYSNHFIYAKTGFIRNGKIEDILDCTDVWFSDETNGNLVEIRAYTYLPDSLNPFLDMYEITQKIKVQYHGGHRGKYQFQAEGLDKHNNKAYTVLFEVRTPRFWVVAPVWDDEYYMKIYKGRHIKTIAEKCRFQSHPSVKCISTINEPTLTWAGGDIIKSQNFKDRWMEFLKKEFSFDLHKLNKAFESKYMSFADVGYYPRIIYSGHYHSHWSGVPGWGFNSNYEIAKARFKHYLMLIYYERTYKAVKELCGDYPVMVKYNWLNIDKMGEQGSGSYMSANSKWMDIIGWDMYPLFLGMGNLTPLNFSGPMPSENGKPLEETKPEEYIPQFTSTAAALPLMSKAYDKPGWLAETACGASKTLAEYTGQLTELSFEALLNMGIDQVHYWAVGPWNRRDRKVEDPYDISEVMRDDRIRPSLKALGKVTQKLKDKRSAVPDFDLFLAYPEDNVILFNATDTGRRWMDCRNICERCHAQGIISTDEVLRPELVKYAKSLAFYDGFYLSQTDKKIINNTDKPVILLGYAFPTNPPLGIQYEEISNPGPDPFSIHENMDIVLPNSEKVRAKSFGLIKPPVSAYIYQNKKIQNTIYMPFFSIGKDLVFGFHLTDPNDYVKVIQWWLKEKGIIK